MEREASSEVRYGSVTDTQSRAEEPIPTDTPFDRDAIRGALKSLKKPRRLAQHPLVDLGIVIARELAGVDDASSVGRGMALREVLQEAIEVLRPHRGEPDLLDRAWHPYLILNRQYVAGRSPTDLAEQLCIGRREYYRRQTHALDLLVSVLLKMEQQCACGSSEEDRYVPFMAPLRPLHTLVGRARFLNDVKRRLSADPPLTFCAFSGLPGVGKTALAIELANDAQVLAHFTDGVLWAGLGRRPDVFALLDAWGRALGLSERELARLSDVETRARALHVAIGLRRMLLVIDDAWQLETALAFKLGGPNCAHMLTTRIPDIAQTFAGDAALEVPELPEGDSLTLLRHIAPVACDSRPGEVRRLAQAAGGLPLALSLVGWHLRKASLGASPQRLQRALEQLDLTQERLRIAQVQPLLEQHPDLPSGTPLSLQAVIGISDEALPPTAQEAIRALSSFAPKPNSCTEEAALAVADVPAEILDTLVDHGLLAAGGLGRYMLHQTVSDYMRVRLAEDVEVQRAVHERLVMYFADYVEAHQEEYTVLELEWPNILIALNLAFKDGMASALIRIVKGLHGFFNARGLYALAMLHGERAVQLAETHDDQQTLIALLHNLGLTAGQYGEYEKARDFFQKGLEFALAVHHQDYASALLRGLGVVHFSLGDYAQAKDVWHRALAVAREIKNRQSEAKILCNLGTLYRNLYELDRSVEFLQRALAIVVEMNDRRGEVMALSNLGISYMELGKLDLSIECHEKVLSVAQEMGDKINEGGSLGSLGQIYKALEAYDQAISYYERSLAIHREIGHRSGEGISLSNLGNTYNILGQTERAIQCLEQSLAITRTVGDLRNSGFNLGNLGEIYGGLGQTEHAIEYLEQALSIARDIGDPRCEEEWLGQLGRVYHRSGQMDRALKHYRQALDIARQIVHHPGVEEWLEGLAKVHRDLGQDEQALACYEEALESARQAGDEKSEHVWQQALDEMIRKLELRDAHL